MPHCRDTHTHSDFPTTNGGAQKVEAQSECVRVAYTLFARFVPDLRARSVLIDKIIRIGAQSEVCHGCAVGWVGRARDDDLALLLLDDDAVLYTLCVNCYRANQPANQPTNQPPPSIQLMQV